MEWEGEVEMASSIKRKEEIECTLHREQRRAERRVGVGGAGKGVCNANERKCSVYAGRRH